MIAVMSDLFSHLATMASGRRKVSPGEVLFHREDPVVVLHLVVAGLVHLVRHKADGGTSVLQKAQEGSILAEASVFSDSYHCDAVAAAETATVCIPAAEVRRRIERDIQFSCLWTRHLALELQSARSRAEVMSLKSVGARLDAWIVWNRVLPPKGQWKRVAEEIGVSPEALYRELSRRSGGENICRGG
jgi:CRP-like cAMP-binding protein